MRERRVLCNLSFGVFCVWHPGPLHAALLPRKLLYQECYCPQEEDIMDSGPLGSCKGPHGVPTKSSRRQQVLAFGILGKGTAEGRNFGAWSGEMVIADRFVLIGVTPLFFIRWR
ncbi:hypothetical protein DBV15_09187 [Temnothorax longispinosus]|uniref:Uncharacterized protein n=1 Tax=Temnothorax longispinosus TaxID=300112 RepID=A0A4S2KNN5_9HYME|nr:hypothetical protein DBV15_09187 [Temnothorax longispinosus]